MRMHGQEHPYGAHIFTPSLFFINPDMCFENSVRTFLCPFCVYTTFIHEAPGPVLRDQVQWAEHT